MAHQTDAVSFQVEYFAGGKWQSDTRYTDREEAEAGAVRMLESNRSPTAVRVAQECFDPATKLFNDVIVFRRSRLDEHNASARGAQFDAAQQWADRRARQRVTGSSRQAGSKLHAVRKSSGWYILLAISLIIGATISLWTMHHLMFTG